MAHDSETVDVIGDNGSFARPTTEHTGPQFPATAPARYPATAARATGSPCLPHESYVLLAENLQGNIFESDDAGKTWPTSLTLPLLAGARSTNRAASRSLRPISYTSTQFDVWYGDINLFKTTAITPSTAAPGGSPRTPLNSWTSEQDGAHDDTGDVMFNPAPTAGACPIAVYRGWRDLSQHRSQQSRVARTRTGCSRTSRRTRPGFGDLMVCG